MLSWLFFFSLWPSVIIMSATFRYPTKEDVQKFKENIKPKTHRVSVRHVYEHSFTGSDVMDAIKKIEGFKKEGDALHFGNLLLQSGTIRPTTFRLYQDFTPKKKYIYEFGDEQFENLFWLDRDDDEPATLLMEDTSKEVLDEDLSEREQRELKPVPKIRGLPYAGNAFMVTGPGDMSRSMQRLGKELCPKYGGIFWINLMHHKYIVVSDPDFVEAVLDGENFGKKTEDDPIFQQLRCFRGEGLTTVSDGCLHRQCQGVVAPKLVKNCFEKYIPIILDTLNDSLRELRHVEEFDARKFWKKATLRSVGKVAMGIDLYCGSKKWDKFNWAITYVADQAINRVFKKAKLAPNRRHKFRDASEHMHKVLLEVVQDRREKLRQHPKCPEDFDLLDIMLTTAMDEKDGEKLYMTNELIRANLTTILSAGHSTTTSMLSWTLNYLHDWSLGNRDYLYKLIHEVDSISGGDRRYQPTLDDVYKRMPFLTNVLYETLRYTPPIPTIVRHCMKTCNIGGYLVHRGDPIMISALGTHLNPKSWADARDYNPERWNKPAEKPCAFIPWASGPRQCIGREFAMLTGRLALFSIINQFSLELSPKANVKPNEHLFVFPEGLIMRARERANLTPIASNGGDDDKDGDKDKKKEKKENDGDGDGGDDDDSPASDGKRNWSGLMNLIQEEEYVVKVIGGTNSGSGTVSTVTQWLTDKALKFNFKCESSPITPDDLLDSIKDDKPDFQVWGFVTATYNGKPPNNCKKFHKWVKEKAGDDSSHLENIRYFVFGCGNTNWQSTYQKMPSFFDESLEKLGAKRIADSAEFDEAKDDIEDVFKEYYKTMAPALMHSLPEIGDKKLRDVNEKYGGDNDVEAGDGGEDDEDFSKESKLEAQPSSSGIEMDTVGKASETDDLEYVASALVEPDDWIKCKVKKVKNITPDSERGTVHIELECDEDVEYESGDHFVVIPKISKEYGERVLEHFVDYDFDTVVKFNCDSDSSKKRFKLPTNKNLTVETILCNLVDLKCKPPKQFLINYSTIVKDEEEAKKLEEIANDKESHEEWLKENEPVSVADVIEKYAPKEDQFDRLLEILPVLSTRTYSITSSPNIHKNEIHLCAGLVNDKFDNGTYKGVCSMYFEGMIDAEDQEVYGYVEKADEGFHVPEDSSKPLILIAAGTGFAPMRGFLHERKHQEADGKNLVFFGCRTEDNDILFKDELKEWEESEFAEIYYAFSRDDNHDKKYVQDVIEEKKDEVWELIDEKEAVIFVCGSGSRMGAGVHDVLLKIFQEHCPDDEDDKEEWAEKYLEDLEDNNRYELDVWG